MSDISKLIDIMARLRDPADGCPWDREQTFRTIAPYTIEEAYEVADAIENDRFDALPDELGDLLFQIVFYARIGAEQGRFGFDDVVAAICDKLIRRHPHVFGGAPVESAEAQTRHWEAIKQRERGQESSLLDDVPLGQPAMARAAKLGRRAASVGFDWPAIGGVRAKVDEELAEVDQALSAGRQADVEAELGDLLFAVVNLCRHAGVDPEQALRGTNSRFVERFSYVERAVRDGGGDWSDYDAGQLDTFWRAAKARQRDT